MSNIIKIKINDEEYEIDLEEDSNINITSIFSNSLKVETLTTDKIDGGKIVANDIYSDSTNKVYVSSSSGEGEYKTLTIDPDLRSGFFIGPIEHTRDSYQSADKLTAFATCWTFRNTSSSSQPAPPLTVGQWYLISESTNESTLSTDSTATWGLVYCYKNTTSGSVAISYTIFIGLPDYINDYSAKTMYLINLAYNGGSITIPSSFNSTVSYK